MSILWPLLIGKRLNKFCLRLLLSFVLVKLSAVFFGGGDLDGEVLSMVESVVGGADGTWAVVFYLGPLWLRLRDSR